MSDGVTAFASTADPAAYVPYAGAERCLAALEEWVGEPERLLCLLRGPEGAGKSMLLSVLAARLGRHAVPVPVSAAGLDPETLVRTLLDALGDPWEGSPRVALARAVARPGVRRLLLLVDDADALAPRTEMWLFDFVRRSAGAVRALLAVRDPRLATELAGAFQSGTDVLALDVPMSREETAAWVRAELTRGGVDDGRRAHFDALAVARLHGRSGGLPGRLRQEAEALLAAAPVVSPAPAQAPGNEAAAAPPAPPPRAPAPAPAAAAPVDAPAAREAAAARLLPEPPPGHLALPPRATAPPAARAASASFRSADGAPPPTRSSVAPEPAPAGRRDALLRWWLAPAVLAFAYVAGFLTSEGMEALRPGPAPFPVVVERSALPPLDAPVGAREPAAAGPAQASAARPTDPFTPPALPEVAGPPADAPSPAPELPAVSAPPPAGARSGEAAAPVPVVPAAPEPAVAVEERAAAAPQPARPPRRAAPPGPRPVEVSVEAEPGAVILVNGQPVGSGSVSGLRLLPGPHRVEVRLADGRVVERVVEVKGTRYEVRLR